MSSNTVPDGAPNPTNWQGGLKAMLGGPWATVAVVAGLAVVLGVLLPKLVSNDTVIDKDRPRTDVKAVASDAKGSAAEAKPGSEYKTPSIPDAPNPQALLGRLFMGTVVVLGLSVGSIWMMRRWLQGQMPANALSREMKLIETLRLGNRNSLHLVHIGNREILVGSDTGGIKSIVQLARPFDDALAEVETTNTTADTIPFVRPQNTNSA